MIGNVKQIRKFAGGVRPTGFDVTVNHCKLFSGKVRVCETPKVIPYMVGDMQTMGGSYVSYVGFEINTANKLERSTTFAVGEFPLKQSFEWNHDYNDDGYGTEQAYIDLQITDLGRAPKVGDFIKLRYLLPEVVWCEFNNVDYTTQLGPSAHHYNFEMFIENSDAGAVCTVLHKGNGITRCNDNGDVNLFSSLIFTPIKKDGEWVGFELTGWLLRPITSMRIKITGHVSADEANGKYRYADLTVQYPSYDNLTVEAYNIPMASDLCIYGTPSDTGNIGLLSGDAVTYYNGRVAPNIDKVWTDKVTYPFALLQNEWLIVFKSYEQLTGTGFNAGMRYVRFSDAGYAYNGESDEFIAYELTDGEWVLRTDLVKTEVYFQYITWASFDLYNDDGTDYQVTMQPISVSILVDHDDSGIPIYK